MTRPGAMARTFGHQPGTSWRELGDCRAASPTGTLCTQCSTSRVPRSLSLIAQRG